MKTAGLNHLALLVDDLEKAERFYSGVLGLALDRRWSDDGGGTRSVWLTIPGGAILMLERAMPGSARSDRGWHLLALTIRAADAASIEAELSRAGVAVESRSKHTLYLRDPEGNVVELKQMPTGSA